MGEAINKYYILNGERTKTINWDNEGGGKIIYEVLKVIEGRPLFYKEHYYRMRNSFLLNSSEIPFTEAELKKDIDELIEINKIKCGNIKITYNLQKKIIKVYFIKHSYPTEEMYRNGVKTILYFGERENPNAKVINSQFRDGVNEKIRSKNAFEAILVNKKGFITEGSRSNIFLIKGETLYTSAVEEVLPGVTRNEIINVARKNKIEVIEKNIDYTNLKEFEALFISGTSPDILPINSVDNFVYNPKQKLLLKIMNLFEYRINEDLKLEN